MAEKIKVKISTNSPTWPLIKQTPNMKGIWEGNQFFINDATSECDWWIIYDGLLKEEKVDCPKDNTILFTAEPPSIKKYDKKFLKQFGLIATNHPKIKGKNIIRTQTALPWYIGWNVKDNSLNVYDKNYDELKNSSYNKKTKLLSTVSSGKTGTSGHRKRLNFVLKAKEHFGNKIDVFGAKVNKVADKWDAIAPYRYHIVIENSVCPDYWTEKLADVYLSDSYPIYFGCSNITDYFSADSLSIIDINKPEEALEIIEKAIASDSFEKSKESRKKAKNLILDKYQLFPLITSIIKERQTKTEKIPITIRPEIIKNKNIILRILSKISKI